MCFGSRFMGCRVDSSKRSFGKIFFSSEFMTAAIYKHNCEPGIMTRMPHRQLILSYLCNRYTATLIIPIRSVSARSHTAGNDAYPLSSMCSSNCISNNWRS